MAWISQFIIIILLYQDFSLGFFQREDGYSRLRKYLRSKMTKQSLDSVETKWIDQPVDHFNNSDRRSWKMKYFQDLKFFKPGGPIYLFIGGEGALTPDYLTGGLLFELAMNTSGAMFASEHRFYGESMPGDNKKLEDLKYLNSRQAIADFIELVWLLHDDDKFQSSKVVVIGGSYAGNLAAWARFLYPQYIYAALASSAPVLAKFDNYEYLETCGDAFKKYGTPACYEHIAQIFKAFTDDFATPEGIERLKKEQNICEDSDLSRKENQFLFFHYAVYPYFTQFSTVESINRTCNSGRFRKEENRCLDIDFENEIKYIQLHGDSWLYQTCSEFGFYQTTSSNEQPFGKQITLENYVNMCNLVYGPNFNAQTIEEAVNKTNDFYGGLKLNVVKVVFTNGEIDPWHRLGVVEDLNHYAPARVIPQMSHCTDLFGEDHDKSIEFIETVQFVKKTIKRWIGL